MEVGSSWLLNSLVLLGAAGMVMALVFGGRLLLPSLPR